MNSRANKIKKRREKRKSILNLIRRYVPINIGTIVFGAIFVYMVISVILYLTTEHISTYQVTAGPLAKNQTYVGIAIRDEEVISSNTGGFITYYARDNSRIKDNGIVYGIGEQKQEDSQVVITDHVLSTLQTDMSSFSSGFDTNEFHDLYRFKYEIEGKLLQNTGVVLPNQTVPVDNITVGNQTICTSLSNGLILYSTDGFEEFSIDQVTKDSFNSKNYHLETLKTKERVEAGTPIYRIITDESWSVVIPLSDKQVIQLADRSSIRVKFLKDNVTQTANIKIHTGSDGAYYGELVFSSGVIRYSSDRFIQLELVTNTQTGLKIPVTAIVKKQFYTIPVEYGTLGGDDDDVGFLIQRRSNKSEENTEFVHLTIYEERDGLYYVDPLDVEAGDIIIQTESKERYTIDKTDTLEGVYCINKGYAVFRKIVIIDKNDEYCIVDTKTPYGIAQFDHIVENSSTVKEQEILY